MSYKIECPKCECVSFIEIQSYGCPVCFQAKVIWAKSKLNRATRPEVRRGWVTKILTLRRTKVSTSRENKEAIEALLHTKDDELSIWETQFLDSILNYLEEHGTLTPGQESKLEEIWERVMRS